MYRERPQWVPNTPWKQPYFTFSPKDNIWVGSEDSPRFQAREDCKVGVLGTCPPILTVLTWNIDFSRPLPDERMSAALSYLKTYLSPSSSIPDENGGGVVVVILLQEMVASDLHLIQAAPWVRDRFHITDLTSRYWASGRYGTCTLIDRRLHIQDVFRVHYERTRMDRDALFVDLALPATSEGAGNFPTSTTSVPDVWAPAEQKPHCGMIIRIGNTHLESLRAVPPLRPHQLSTASRFMHGPNIHAAILAGDLNAIEPFDRTLHTDNGLEDAYLKLGGEEDSDRGYTWGQMAATYERERYGCCRMDKVLFAGGVEVKRVERVGMGVEVEDREEREVLRMEAGLEAGWVTDHLGLRADFEIIGYNRG